jgi:MATE family multidrug resistance protein
MAGLGYGTAISFSLSLIVLLSMMWIRKEFRQYWLSGTWRKLPWCYLKEIFLVGCPLGVMFFVEVGFFFCLALIMGHYGVLYLAANQLAVQLPIAQGISVRVGFLLGAQEPLHAHRALISGVLFAWIMGIGFAVFGWFGSSLVLQLDFSKAPPVMLVYYFKHFLLWMGVFQLFESQRIALFGGLRAHKDTRYTMIVSVISFWCIALPCGYLFSFGMGAEGYWLSFAVSALIGVSLLWRRYYRMVKPGFMANVLPQ